MSVSLSPSKNLGFHRPLNVLVKRPLTITNHNAQPVAFKVKTTAPSLYCVRPNSGRINPGESLDVSVEPPLNAICKDKFLVQSSLITPGKEAMSLQDIWIGAEDVLGEEGKVYQQKLRVIYLPAKGQTLVEEEEEEEEGGQTSTTIMNTRVSRYDTVRQHPGVNGETQPAPFSPPSSPPGDFSAAKEPHEEHPSFNAPSAVLTPPEASAPAPKHEPEPVLAAPIPQSSPLSAPTARTSAESIPPPVVLPPAADAYAARYAEAQAEIERLRALLAASQPAPPTELRRRTREQSAEDVTTADTAALRETLYKEGVPLEVVLIIALGVFVTTYLFF
ncbi:PapD-like protein [Mycena latifolia]|nr:PapD-like protein [Mycena latifolia]